MPRPLRVLVVDDHRDTADSTAQLVALLGYDARVAYTGTAAAAAAAAFHPDVVLLDIGLAGDSGYAVARAVCERCPVRPVLVALTGYQHLEDRSRHEGFDHHFLKPLDPGDLAAVLAASRPPGGA